MADDLDKYVAERERREPGFSALVEAAERRRDFTRAMAERRKASGLSQTQIAARMDTSASIVSRLENGSDVRISTLEKYMAALGLELELLAKQRNKRASRARRRPRTATG